MNHRYKINGCIFLKNDAHGSQINPKHYGKKKWIKNVLYVLIRNCLFTFSELIDALINFFGPMKRKW